MIKEIVMSNSITKICDMAFKFCQSLTKLVLSNNIKEIPYEMCYNNFLLENIMILYSVTKICSGAFSYCSLTKINMHYPIVMV